jgi:Fe-S cluster assembly protein SufD
MTAVAEQTGAWLDSFAVQAPAEPWIQALREAAFERFVQLGFPTTHEEDWRFTNVAPIARTRFRVIAADPQLRIPDGVQETGPGDARSDLARHAADGNAFVALNTAFLGKVNVLRVPQGAVVQSPIDITFDVAEPEGPVAVHPRTLILVGANAQCAIIERYQGAGAYLTNAVTEIVAGEGAVVDHYKIQTESLEAFHVGSMFATLGRSANFTTTSIALGGGLVRNDVTATLAEGTEATLNGLYVAGGSQHVDNHTTIDHAKPHGSSRELYKGILDGKAHAVFNGRILVRQDAQKTDSKQTNKNLVLSDDATIDTKPELQIFADDVRCTHGATIGQLDAESLFYLQSRGIGRSDARRLLTYAFAQDVVDRIKLPSLRDSLERILFEKFHERT